MSDGADLFCKLAKTAFYNNDTYHADEKQLVEYYYILIDLSFLVFLFPTND
jgi:hypothetical protein